MQQLDYDNKESQFSVQFYFTCVVGPIFYLCCRSNLSGEVLLSSAEFDTVVPRAGMSSVL